MFLEAKHVVQCTSLLSNAAHIHMIVIHHFYHHPEQSQPTYRVLWVPFILSTKSLSAQAIANLSFEVSPLCFSVNECKFLMENNFSAKVARQCFWLSTSQQVRDLFVCLFVLSLVCLCMRYIGHNTDNASYLFPQKLQQIQ